MTHTPFFQSAGITAEALSDIIRTALVVLSLIWAAWIVLGVIHKIDQPDCNLVALASRVLGVLVIVSSCIGLVYLPTGSQRPLNHFIYTKL